VEEIYKNTRRFAYVLYYEIMADMPTAILQLLGKKVPDFYRV